MEKRTNSATPLADITWKNDITLIHNLLENADQNDKNYALHVTAVQGFNSIMKILLDNGAKVDHTRNYHPLVEAAKNGNLEGVQILLNHGISINARDSKALVKSAQEGHAEMVKFLLENGINIQGSNHRAIEVASSNNHVEVVKTLIDFGSPTDVNEGFPLAKACREGYYQIASLLINNGANPKGYKDFNKPIYLADKYKHPAIVTLLTEYGADLSQVNIKEVKKIDVNKLYSAVKKTQKILAADHDLQKSLEKSAKQIELSSPQVVNKPRKANQKFEQFINNLSNTEDKANKKPKM